MSDEAKIFAILAVMLICLIFPGVGIALTAVAWISVCIFLVIVRCFCVYGAKAKNEPSIDAKIEIPLVDIPDLAKVVAEEKAVAEARAAAKAVYDEKAKRDFTYFKIAVPILVGCVLLSNYIDEPVAIDKKTTTVCVKNAAGNTECKY